MTTTYKNNLRQLINNAKDKGLFKYDIELARMLKLDETKMNYPHLWCTKGMSQNDIREYGVQLCNELGCTLNDLMVEEDKDVVLEAENQDFNQVWSYSRKPKTQVKALPKILILEDVANVLALWSRILKDKLKIFKLNHIVQVADTAKTGQAIITAEGDNLKLILLDLSLTDTTDSLSELEEALSRTSAKVIVMSACADDNLVQALKNHPRVFAFIRKGSESMEDLHSSMSHIDKALLGN
jgi:CheY-like chemotaxis protein